MYLSRKNGVNGRKRAYMCCRSELTWISWHWHQSGPKDWVFHNESHRPWQQNDHSRCVTTTGFLPDLVSFWVSYKGSLSILPYRTALMVSLVTVGFCHQDWTYASSGAEIDLPPHNSVLHTSFTHCHDPKLMKVRPSELGIEQGTFGPRSNMLSTRPPLHLSNYLMILHVFSFLDG